MFSIFEEACFRNDLVIKMKVKPETRNFDAVGNLYSAFKIIQEVFFFFFFFFFLFYKSLLRRTKFSNACHDSM